MTIFGRVFIITACLVCLSHTTVGQTGDQAKALMTKLFVTNAYSSKIRPALNQSAYTAVYVSLNLLNINGIDMLAETLKTTGFLSVQWVDEYLTWNTSDYGGITFAHYPQSDVWTPSLHLKNSYLPFQDLGSSNMNLEVRSSGTIIWYPFEVFQTTCDVDITYFPFDVQTCKLTFIAWGFYPTEIYLFSGSGSFNMEDYEPNAEWEILQTSYELSPDPDESTITFNIKLKRRPLYDSLTFVFPIVLLGCLNLCVFILPCESGERAGYTVTVFLAFSVFLTIFESAMPANSVKTAILSVYVILQTVQSTVITMVALSMLRCYTFDEKVTPIPKILIGIRRITQLHYCRKKSHDDQVETLKGNNRPDSKASQCNENIFAKRTQKEDQNNEEDIAKVEVYTWKDVINGLDVLFFIVFGISFSLTTMVCFLLASSSPQK